MKMRWIVGAALVAATLGLGAVEARAQEACAIPEDVPAPLFDSEIGFVDTLGAGFPMSVAACDKVASTALKTCQKTVSAAVRCWKGVGKGLAKAGKTVCREQGDSEDLCWEFIEGEVASLAAAVQGSALAGLAACEAEATGLRILCIGF